jgi:hypothetical protein
MLNEKDKNTNIGRQNNTQSFRQSIDFGLNFDSTTDRHSINTCRKLTNHYSNVYTIEKFDAKYQLLFEYIISILDVY